MLDCWPFFAAAAALASAAALAAALALPLAAAGLLPLGAMADNTGKGESS